jgi:predicted transcriptional regulator
VLSEALKKLIAKGIVKREMINNSPTYLIENPEAISKWVKRRSNKDIQALKQKQEDFERFSQTLVSNSVKPRVRFFTGIEGLKESYEEVHKYEAKELLCYMSVTKALYVCNQSLRKRDA